MRWLANFAIWLGVAIAIAVPIGLAATSPLLQWRDAIYIAGGFAGIVALACLLVQPMLVAGYLPGLGGLAGRRAHRAVGVGLVLAVVVHVGALWITSPPDVIDVLLVRSPTPFALWGLIAMWAVFGAALLAGFRRRLWIRPSLWRRLHAAFAMAVVLGTILHALLIEGAMETVSKVALCLLVLGLTAKAMIDLRIWFARRAAR